jgi:signal transduction histidine kinase
VTEPRLKNNSAADLRLWKRFLSSWKTAAAVVWLLFSVALAIWWLIFGLGQIDRISQIAGNVPENLVADIARRHRMLLSEGATLVLLLIGGGVALLYHVNREARRNQVMREFFAAFTHDLKTSLASLRLQAESLQEDLNAPNNNQNSLQNTIQNNGAGSEKLIRRLVKDTIRLELQLENSLLLASPKDNSRLLFEGLELSETVQSIAHQWPDLQIIVEGRAKVVGDQRAIESIFKNLLQNAVIHGRATQVKISIQKLDESAVVCIGDNGRGFQGDRSRLGKIFERHSSSSGSGLGLHLAMSLAKRMRGHLQLPVQAETGKGFVVEVHLPLFSADENFAEGKA